MSAKEPDSPGPSLMVGWEDMSDPDRGAALLHVWKAHWQGDESATQEHPARYGHDTTLAALSAVDASAHARAVTGGYARVVERIGSMEFHRLYNLALPAAD